MMRFATVNAYIQEEQCPPQTNAETRTALPIANQCGQQCRFFVPIGSYLTVMTFFDIVQSLKDIPIQSRRCKPMQQSEPALPIQANGLAGSAFLLVRIEQFDTQWDILVC